MKTYFLLCLLLWTALMLPASAQKKQAIQAQSEKQFQQMTELVNSLHFEIKIDRVYPQNGMDVSRFNPEGVISITDSTAKGHLPYFGRAYSLPYGGDSGIEFDNKIKNSEIEIKERRKRKTILYRFEVPAKNDLYRFILTISPNGTTRVEMNSNNRTPISYSGDIFPHPKTK